MECISCQRKEQKGIKFPCPRCKDALFRCERCRTLSNDYKCAKCSFEGP